jgi:hypothetical protein
MIAGLSAGFVVFVVFAIVVQLVRPSGSVAAFAFSLLAGLAIAVTVAVTRVRSAAGRRVAVLAAAGLLPYLAGSVPLLGDLIASVVLSLVSLLLAVLVWLVAIASWRRRVRRAPRAG